MNFNEKIEQLRELISHSVKPLLSEKVIIADAPFTDNIGDILIWQGTVDFLHENDFKILGIYGAGYFTFPKLDKDITIILMGGGHFGDLWRMFHDIKMEIIARYPDNRIVMLPQSVCYQNEDLIPKDADLMARHSDLHLFARDQPSFDILSAHFARNHVYIAPDLAFCIDSQRLAPYRNREQGKTLFLLRGDKELPEDAPTALQEADLTSDWPINKRFGLTIRNFKRARRVLWDLKRYGLRSRLIDALICAAGNRLIRDYLTKTGCEFLEPFSRIVTTRLHPMILAVLLHKPVEYIDNTYGKLSAYAQTWLHDLPGVKPYGRD